MFEISFNKLMQLHNNTARAIDARGLLTRASSINYSVHLAEKVALDNISLAKTFASKMNMLRKEWQITRGNMSIDYKQIYNEYADALVNLVAAFTTQKSDNFEADCSPSIVLFFKSLGIEVSQQFGYNAMEKRIEISKDIIRYFSGYDHIAKTPLGKAQITRKRELVVQRTSQCRH